MPYEKFGVMPGKPEETLNQWSRKLEYLFNKNLNIDNIVSTGLITNAELVGLNDTGGYYASTNHTVENALQQLGSTLFNIPAGNVKITDTGLYYTSTSVEGALQELASTIQNLPSSYLNVSFLTPLESTTTNIKLNYSTRNFIINASSELDTIQDIGTTAAVSFDSLTASSNVQGLTGKFGNVAGGNYSEFETDGTLKFNGDATVFDDMNGSVLELQIQGVGLSINTNENTLDYSTNADLGDYAFDNYQFTHRRKNGTDVYPHVHWVQKENTIPNLLIKYRWQVNGQSHTTTWTDYPMTSLAFTYTAGSLNQISYGPSVPSPSTGDLSCLMQIRLYRDGDNNSSAFASTESYSTTVNIMFVDIHNEQDTAGSRQQYIK